VKTQPQADKNMRAFILQQERTASYNPFSGLEKEKKVVWQYTIWETNQAY